MPHFQQQRVVRLPDCRGGDKSQRLDRGDGRDAPMLQRAEPATRMAQAKAAVAPLPFGPPVAAPHAASRLARPDNFETHAEIAHAVGHFSRRDAAISNSPTLAASCLAAIRAAMASSRGARTLLLLCFFLFFFL